MLSKPSLQQSNSLDVKSDISTWRLIPFLQMSGPVQMALDTWLLDQHQRGLHPPTLRFYTWEPAAISLGYHQHRYPEAWKQLIWQGRSLDLVRRPSGGRAVLHQGDLTYAIVTSGLSGSRLEAYLTLCEFLIQGWRSLGVNLNYGESGRGYIHNPNCFGTATIADLTLDGTKFIGSAQIRRGQALLQHGSMRLSQDPALFQQVFGVSDEPIRLPSHLSADTLVETAIDALVASARQCFEIDFVVQPLSPAEWQNVLDQSVSQSLSQSKST